VADLHQQLLAELDRCDPHGPAVKALRAAVELHAPDEHGRCRPCTALARRAGNHVRWRVIHPCETVQAIARELGVQEDNHHGQG
jgi:hypothetical protein